MLEDFLEVSFSFLTQLLWSQSAIPMEKWGRRWGFLQLWNPSAGRTFPACVSQHSWTPLPVSSKKNGSQDFGWDMSLFVVKDNGNFQNAAGKPLQVFSSKHSMKVREVNSVGRGRWVEKRQPSSLFMISAWQRGYCKLCRLYAPRLPPWVLSLYAKQFYNSVRNL